MHRLKMHMHRNAADPFNAVLGLKVTAEFAAKCVPLLEDNSDLLTSMDILSLISEVTALAADKDVKKKKVTTEVIRFTERIGRYAPGSIVVVRLQELKTPRDKEGNAKIVHRFGRFSHFLDSHTCLVTLHPFEERDSYFIALTADVSLPPKEEMDALCLDDARAYNVVESPIREIDKHVYDVSLEYMIQYLGRVGRLDERIVRAAHQIYLFSNSLNRKKRDTGDDEDEEPFPSVGIPLFSLGPLLGKTFEIASEVKRECRSHDYADLDLIADKCRMMVTHWINDVTPSWELVNGALVKKIIAFYKDFDPPEISMASLPQGKSPPQCWREMRFKELDQIFKAALEYVNRNLAYILNGKQKRLFNESLLEQATNLSEFSLRIFFPLPFIISPFIFLDFLMIFEDLTFSIFLIPLSSSTTTRCLLPHHPRL